MDTAIRVHILDKSVHTKTLGKGINSIIVYPPMGKLQTRMGSLALVRQPVLENFKFEPVILRLKIDLVSNPARHEGFLITFINYHRRKWIKSWTMLFDLHIVPVTLGKV